MGRTVVVLGLALILLTGCAAHAEVSSTHSATVAPSPTATATASAKLLHWNCADTHGGRECQKAEQSNKHLVATLHTVFLRDDVFIELTQSNFTNDIVGSIVASLWR